MVGKVTSKGDRVMRAQVARRNFHLDGRGITVGVISDSFDALEGADLDIASGDLPGRGNPLGHTQPVRVLKELKIGGDEGRAMLQIITDIAPKAKLLFHTAYSPSGRLSEESFSQAVRALTRAGANIIVDDVGFPAPLFQDGLAARTVNQVADQGIAYFSAVGNDGNRAYRSTFSPSSQFTFRGKTYEAHNFAADVSVNPSVPGTAQSTDLFQNVSLDFGDFIAPLLGWDQASGKIISDLELFLVDKPQLPEAGGKILATSITQFSQGVEQPLEQLVYASPNRQTAYLIIARRVDSSNLTNQIQWISTANGSDRNVIYQYVNDGSQIQEPSTIYGQPNARGAIAVGAVPVQQTPLFGVNPPVLSLFSSRGGTPILLDDQGQRLPAPEIRQKPEVTAPNGVKTTLEGFSPFFGTSAAAPHAAAVAALILQRAGGARRLSPTQIIKVMQHTAIPMDKPGNFRSGAGLLQADAAVLAASTVQTQGSNRSEALRGRAGADTIHGLKGRDQLLGGRGFDALLGGSGHDTLAGNAGNDYLVGNLGQDFLMGGGENDTLLGNQGKDRLDGGQGDDLLAGGVGKNWHRGGKGNNLHVLFTTGVAMIVDFQVGRDQLGLSSNLRFEQMQIVQQGGNTLIRFHQQTLAKLLEVTQPLQAEDFLSIAIPD